MYSLDNARYRMRKGVEEDKASLERELDAQIARTSQKGYSGFDKFNFSDFRLDRDEVKEVLDKYKEAGYDAKLHWPNRHKNTLTISFGWA